MENSAIFRPQFALSHNEIKVHFSKNKDDFIVREVPLYECSGQGEHCVVKLEKKDLTTNEMLKILAEHLGIKMRDFGYAGLKDKEGLTSQFVSLPYKFSQNLASFSHEKIKILEINRHNNKLRIGHLKGNNFFIRLKKVDKMSATIISNVLEKLGQIGYPNYFGYQRFGKYGDNAKSGEEILSGKNSIKNPKIRDFLISAYQSDIFNRWLSKRVEMSKFADKFSPKELCEIYPFLKDEISDFKSQNTFFRVLRGDVMGHYPFGKCFLCEDIKSESERFVKRDITVTGAIFGAKMMRADSVAKVIEDEILPSNEIMAKISGSRRFAWCFLENLEYSYDENNAHFLIKFFLPKGSYATLVLEEILHTRLKEDL